MPGTTMSAAFVEIGHSEVLWVQGGVYGHKITVRLQLLSQLMRGSFTLDHSRAQAKLYFQFAKLYAQ